MRELLDAARSLVEASDSLASMLGSSYEGFMQSLKGRLDDPRVIALIQAGLNDGVKADDIAKITVKNIKVSDLRPCQTEVDIGKSLFYPVTDDDTAKRCLHGEGVELGGFPIVTFRGKYIIDGHHRWSQAYATNSDAHMVAQDLTLGTMDPMDALKAVQLAIAASSGSVPTKSVSGSNLLTAPEAVVKAFVYDKMRIELLPLYADHGVGADLGEVANFIWANIEVMQRKSQPVTGASERGLMPQTDQAPGWEKSLKAGKVDWTAPFSVGEDKEQQNRIDQLKEDFIRRT